VPVPRDASQDRHDRSTNGTHHLVRHATGRQTTPVLEGKSVGKKKLPDPHLNGGVGEGRLLAACEVLEHVGQSSPVRSSGPVGIVFARK
jgi:hypothetical protein